jgi:hypothetical protein
MQGPPRECCTCSAPSRSAYWLSTRLALPRRSMTLQQLRVELRMIRERCNFESHNRMLIQ